MPWQAYLHYNDARIIAKAYPSQVKLLRFWNRSLANSGPKADGLVHDWGLSSNDNWSFLGDWLSPHGSEPSITPEASLFNNCYILYCIRIVAKIAAVLEKPDDVAMYNRAAAVLAAAIHTKFFVDGNNASADGDGGAGAGAGGAARAGDGGLPYYLNTLQTHLTMALVAEVPPTAAIRKQVMKTLRRSILVDQQGHIDTGLHGTYFMTKLLTDTAYGSGFGGQDDLVETFALVKGHPGYVDLLENGYSTWPEAWGACAADENRTSRMYECKKWTSGSLSQLHGTLNGIGQFFIAGLGGIRRIPGTAGFQEFELRPTFTLQQATAVTASYVSPFGAVKSSYSVQANSRGGAAAPEPGAHESGIPAAAASAAAASTAPSITVEYNVTVPPNTRATVHIPATSPQSVTEGTKGTPASHAAGVRFVGMDGSSGDGGNGKVALFAVGSGTYTFSSTR